MEVTVDRDSLPPEENIPAHYEPRSDPGYRFRANQVVESGGSGVDVSQVFSDGEIPLEAETGHHDPKVIGTADISGYEGREEDLEAIIDVCEEFGIDVRTILLKVPGPEHTLFKDGDNSAFFGSPEAAIYPVENGTDRFGLWARHDESKVPIRLRYENGYVVLEEDQRSDLGERLVEEGVPVEHRSPPYQEFDTIPAEWENIFGDRKPERELTGDSDTFVLPTDFFEKPRDEDQEPYDAVFFYATDDDSGERLGRYRALIDDRDLGDFIASRPRQFNFEIKSVVQASE